METQIRQSVIHTGCRRLITCWLLFPLSRPSAGMAPEFKPLDIFSSENSVWTSFSLSSLSEELVEYVEVVTSDWTRSSHSSELTVPCEESKNFPILWKCRHSNFIIKVLPYIVNLACKHGSTKYQKNFHHLCKLI